MQIHARTHTHTLARRSVGRHTHTHTTSYVKTITCRCPRHTLTCVFRGRRCFTVRSYTRRVHSSLLLVTFSHLVYTIIINIIIITIIKIINYYYYYNYNILVIIIFIIIIIVIATIVVFAVFDIIIITVVIGATRNNNILKIASVRVWVVEGRCTVRGSSADDNVTRTTFDWPAVGGLTV